MIPCTEHLFITDYAKKPRLTVSGNVEPRSGIRLADFSNFRKGSQTRRENIGLHVRQTWELLTSWYSAIHTVIERRATLSSDSAKSPSSMHSSERGSGSETEREPGSSEDQDSVILKHFLIYAPRVHVSPDTSIGSRLIST